MSINNELRLIGNVVKDPDIFTSEHGKFAKLRIASNTKRGDSEETLYIDLKIYGNSYKDLEYHDISKGDKVIAYGRLAVDEFVDKNEIKRREPVVYCNSLMKVARRQITEETF
jgi:single-stranded DNA-binding protein